MMAMSTMHASRAGAAMRGGCAREGGEDAVRSAFKKCCGGRRGRVCRRRRFASQRPVERIVVEPRDRHAIDGAPLRRLGLLGDQDAQAGQPHFTVDLRQADGISLGLPGVEGFACSHV